MTKNNYNDDDHDHHDNDTTTTIITMNQEPDDNDETESTSQREQQEEQQVMLEDLRRHLNWATVQLAASNLMDPEATQALAWILQVNAAHVYAYIQQQEAEAEARAVLTHGEEEEEEEEENMMQVDEEEAQLYAEITTPEQEQEQLLLLLPSARSLESLFVTDDEMPVKPMELPPPLPPVSSSSSSSSWNPLIFKHPFAIGKLKHVQAASDTLASMCAVAVYNMGLACQCQSLCSSANATSSAAKERRRLQAQAHEFYQQAHHILDELPSLNPDSTLFCVYLAVCNNMAELLQEMKHDNEQEQQNHDDDEAIVQWQESLTSALGSVPPSHSCCVYLHFLCASDAYTTNMACFPEEQDDEKEQTRQP